MYNQAKTKIVISFFLLLIAIAVANIAILPKVFAGVLVNTSVIQLGGASNVNPMIVNDGQSLAIAFTTVGTTAANPSITLTFTGWNNTGSGASFTGAVNSTQTISNTGCTSLTGASAGLPGTLSASGATSGGNGIITISITGGSSLSATTSYCTELTSTTAVTNPGTAGDYNVTLNDSVDSVTVGIDVLNSGGNTYQVTAIINPTFTMSLSATTDSFTGPLSSSSATVTNGVTTTINTNALDGWFVWAKDSNAGLTSASAGHTINSVACGSNYNFAGNTGSDNYGLGVSANSTTNYNYQATHDHGSCLSNTTFNEVATSNTVAANVQFVTHELANISSTSPAGTDYTDTITEIGAGSF